MKSSALWSVFRQLRASAHLYSLGLSILLLVSCAQEEKPWEFSKVGNQWVLLRNGSPFYIKGGAAWGYDFLEELVAAGGNAIRANPSTKGLNKAKKLGVFVLVNLPVRGERDGLDWDNEQQVSEQKREILELVDYYKDHPAVMMWSVGNELNIIPRGSSGERVPHHPELWKRLNDLAREIKQIDPDHPVTVCSGSNTTEEGLRCGWFAEDCPDIDLLGVNTFSKILEIGPLVEKYWKKPYFFSEWGPDMTWETPKTKWNVRTEPTSSEKAATISYRYENAIVTDTNCVGSFVFFWGERQQTTHTWQGLFRDGLKTESIDVMQHLWTGAWPNNRAPAVKGISIEGQEDPMDIRLNPSVEYQAQVSCHDPENGKLEITWEIRPEVVRPPGDYAGRLQKRVEPNPNLILSQEATSVRFKAPRDKGAYRLFVQVTDGQGSAGYANVCFYVDGALS